MTAVAIPPIAMPFFSQVTIWITPKTIARMAKITLTPLQKQSRDMIPRTKDATPKPTPSFLPFGPTCGPVCPLVYGLLL